MKFDFESIIERHKLDALAVDACNEDCCDFAPKVPINDFSSFVDDFESSLSLLSFIEVNKRDLFDFLGTNIK